MRCATCDKMLNEWESGRKDPTTNEYYDLCGPCYNAYRSALAELEDSTKGTEPRDKLVIN